MNKFVYVLFVLLALPAAFAACPVKIAATNTQALLLELPVLNTDLQACPTAIPSPLDKLVGNGNVLFSIAMTDGSTQTIFITTSANQATAVALGTGTARWTASITESDLDAILASPTRGAALSQTFSQKKLVVRANSFGRRIGWFFVKPFVLRSVNKNLQANPPQQRAAPLTSQPYTPGRPAHCDETYMEGHEGYQYAKTLWDGYKADTDGVCQMQQGYMNDNHCIYGVQGGKTIPYYLCWYRVS
jgi:hypothetical protein